MGMLRPIKKRLTAADATGVMTIHDIFRSSLLGGLIDMSVSISVMCRTLPGLQAASWLGGWARLVSPELCAPSPAALRCGLSGFEDRQAWLGSNPTPAHGRTDTPPAGRRTGSGCQEELQRDVDPLAPREFGVLSPREDGAFPGGARLVPMARHERIDAILERSIKSV